MISEECLSIETAEQFLNCLQILIKQCDESEARFEALREKQTETVSTLRSIFRRRRKNSRVNPLPLRPRLQRNSTGVSGGKLNRIIVIIKQIPHMRPTTN
jgi:hypothetical protein